MVPKHILLYYYNTTAHSFCLTFTFWVFKYLLLIASQLASNPSDEGTDITKKSVYNFVDDPDKLLMHCIGNGAIYQPMIHPHIAAHVCAFKSMLTQSNASSKV